MPKRASSFRDDLLADLADPQEAASYLNAAMEDSEEMFLVALRDVAEAKQMAKVAEGAGVARESVYRMLTARGNPTYTSLLGILHAVGLKIKIGVQTVNNAPIQPMNPSDENTRTGDLGVGAGDANDSHNQNRLVDRIDATGIWSAREATEAREWEQRKGMSTAMAAAQNSGELRQAHS